MRYLRTNTACRLTVGPFMDKGDGITPETALTVTNCKLTLMVDDANVPTLVLDAAATAAAGNNDMIHVAGDDAGFYDLELTAANLNYLGRAMLAITDAANHCPVFHEFMIIPANIYDSMILGTDLFDVSATQFAGQTITAGAGVTMPATVASSTNITAGTITTVSGNVNGNVGGSVASVTGLTASDVGAIKTKTDSLTFTSAGYVDSNLLKIGGVTQSATDLKDFADTGYDPATHKVQGVVLTDTATTLTGHTAQTGDSYAIVNGASGLVAIKTVDDAIKAKTDLIPAAPASTTNITAGTITTVTNLTNSPTNGDFTNTMKTSIGTAVAASAVASVTGNVGGNVTGSVGSVVGAVGSVTGLTASNLDTTVSSRLATVGYTAPPSAAQNATAVLTTAMTESYAADGVAPTLAQAIFLTQQSLSEFAISGTTISVKKLDGTTEAATFTLDDATTPTSRTRAT